MSSIKEIVEQEAQELSLGVVNVLHLHREGTFLRAYDWSAWLACHYLNAFKVSKRLFKGVETPVVYIGFPETSLNKWTPEGCDLKSDDSGKQFAMTLPEGMMQGETPEGLAEAYKQWKDGIPLSESHSGMRKGGGDVQLVDDVSDGVAQVTLTQIMQRVLAYPIESKSPLDCMIFLASVKQQLAQII